MPPIFKKLDAFIPALSLLGNVWIAVFLCVVAQHNTAIHTWLPTPVCFFLLYYIYSKCMYFWVEHFTNFHWRQFSKSWTPSFLPYNAPQPINCMLFYLLFHNKYNMQFIGSIPTPVCFFLLYYIYSKYILLWEHLLCFIIDANFQKAGRLHSCLIPAPVVFYTFHFILCFHTKCERYKIRVPTPVCFFLFYYIISNNMYTTQNYFPSSQKIDHKNHLIFHNTVGYHETPKMMIF